MSNVVQLPRPAEARARPDPLGFYVRVGFNDHVELLDLIATGERGVFGFVFEAQNVIRHRELIIEARKRGFEVILDPKTQPMALPYGYKDSLTTLPWAADRHHVLSDFDGDKGRDKAEKIVEFALTYDFTKVLGPTHLLSGANDPWLRRDIAMMAWTSNNISKAGKRLGLLYSLALPVAALRKTEERRALLSATNDAPCEAIWLKVENFGDSSTGEKTAAYIDACRDLHRREVPVIGDHIGGLPGLGALALGGLGGMAHGVTMQQNFSASSWRRPSKGGGGASRRIYFPGLDMLMKPAAAEALLKSPRMKARCGCHDTHCCPHGIKDMISRPARHALYQRAREIEGIGILPPTLRASNYIERHVRNVSDTVAALATVSGLDPDLQKSLVKKQEHMGLFRRAMAHAAENVDEKSFAISPKRRTTEE